MQRCCDTFKRMNSLNRHITVWICHLFNCDWLFGTRRFLRYRHGHGTVATRIYPSHTSRFLGRRISEIRKTFHNSLGLETLYAISKLIQHRFMRILSRLWIDNWHKIAHLLAVLFDIHINKVKRLDTAILEWHCVHVAPGFLPRFRICSENICTMIELWITYLLWSMLMFTPVSVCTCIFWIYLYIYILHIYSYDNGDVNR